MKVNGNGHGKGHRNGHRNGYANSHRNGQGTAEGLAGHGTGLHVAVIMDGNGRWAAARGRMRTAGHRAGADAVRRTVEAAPELGVGTLTLFAFSADNWERPPQEVGTLMRLFRSYLEAEARRCAEKGVRIAVIGRRDRLPAGLVEAIEAAEAATSGVSGVSGVSGAAGTASLLLRIAVDYSARDAILRAALRLAGPRPAEGTTGPRPANGSTGPGQAGGSPAGALSRDEFARLLAEPHDGLPVPDVDLLIRTGGEKRLSDFLLWECAYAELVFTERMWPDFATADLAAAVAEFHRRERRFGKVPASPHAPPIERPADSLGAA